MKKLMNVFVLASSFVILLLATNHLRQFAQSEHKSAALSSSENRKQVIANYGKLPMRFEANNGQFNERVKFVTRGHGYTMFLTKNEAVLSLRNSKVADRNLDEASNNEQPRSTIVHMKLVGANANPTVAALDELPGKSNYFKGNDRSQWRTNVANYKKVHYEGIYPGVDLVYYGNQRRLEYDFIVAPGVDPDVIRMQFHGLAEGDGQPAIAVADNGDLLLHTDGGEIRQQKPFIYQDLAGERQQIDGAYHLLADNQVGFSVADYDATHPLVIDPVLVYSTFLGGSGNDIGYGIAIDGSGNAYITGETEDATTDYPATAGAFDETHNGGSSDVFVSKLGADGSTLLYSTFLGGSSQDVGRGIAVDGNGNAYIIGSTLDAATDYPTTIGAFDETHNGTFDVFVSKLSADGSSLLYSTFLGGNSADAGRSIALDGSNNAYITGTTRDGATDFPTTAGSLDEIHNGGDDAFISKLSADGSTLLYSTFLGGSGSDAGAAIAIDASGNAYITGLTADAATDFPATAGAFDETHNGGVNDAFVSKLSADGSTLLYSTFLGGNGSDNGTDVAVNVSGNAYITGETADAATDFPVTAGAFDETHNGGKDVFVTQLSADGSSPLYSTFLGGSDADIGIGIAVDGSGNAYITGQTADATTDFPVTAGAFDETHNGGFDDAFVSQLSADGSSLLYSTFLGGGGGDVGFGIALDISDNVYVTGLAGEDVSAFPTTAGAFDETHNGSVDAFVAKFGGFHCFVVTNTNDAGPGSFRQAILDANAMANIDASTPDTIKFNISGAGPHTIQPLSGLPIIIDPVIIDGTTQLGADCSSWPPTLLIELDGSNASFNNGLQLDTGSDGSTIRGLVINRFEIDGLNMNESNGHLVECNFIGTDVIGTIALGNGDDGIDIRDSNGNTIGGPGKGNLVSANAEDGISINVDANDNLVQGNIIGASVNGADALGNARHGINVLGESFGNLIGGTASGAANIIAYNASAGVLVADPGSIGNAILGNAIHSNGGLGIEHTEDPDNLPDGVTANDAGDGDSGPNNLQNFPVLTEAATDGSGSITITGTLNSTPSTNDFRLEFFANTVCNGDQNGNPQTDNYGEGETFLGFTTVSTDGNGDASFSVTLSATVPAGAFITATATAPDNSTSEFAQCVAAVQGDDCSLATVINIAVVEIDDILATQTMPGDARDELEAAQADLTLALDYLAQGDQHNANIALQSGWEHGEEAAEEGADLTDAIDAMLDPSRELAVCTIDIATPLAQGNWMRMWALNYANSQLAKGDDDADDGKNFQAIEHYLNAYGSAQWIIDQAGGSSNGSGNAVALGNSGSGRSSGSLGLGVMAKSGASPSTPLRTSSTEAVTQMTELLAVADGESVRLSWATVSESGNKGFYVYRAERKTEAMKKVKSRNKDGMPEDTEYKQISKDLLPGAGSSDKLLSYSYVDTQAKKNWTYYYKIAQVSESASSKKGKGKSGEQETLHGVISAVVTGKAGRLAKGSDLTGESSLDALPAEFGLQQNYPNPFNPTTTISFALPEASAVTLSIYNIAGQLVRTLAAGQMAAGVHGLPWDGRNDQGQPVVSGVYLYRLAATPASGAAQPFVQVRRMVLMK